MDNQQNSPPDIGSIINNRFLVLAEIGSGGFGTVFKIHDHVDNKKKAMKLIENDENGVDSYLNEMKAFDLLKNVPGIPELDQEILVPGHIGFVTPLLLTDVSHLGMNSKKRILTAQSTIAIGFHVLGILESVHSINLVHRDVKAANIMLKVNHRGNPYPLSLIDFGICLDVGFEREADISDSFSNTRYATPAMISGKIATPTDDVLMMLYTLINLRGLSPFYGENEDDVKAVCQKKLLFENNPSDLVKEEWIILFAWELMKSLKNGHPNYSRLKEILKEGLAGFDPERYQFKAKNCGKDKYMLE